MQRSLLAVILILGIAFKLQSQPCLPGWKYMEKISLSNPNGILTNFQVNLSINTYDLINTGRMAADGRDIRFVTASGVILPYWVENGTLNTSTTRIWVKTDVLQAYPALTTMYLFYGNSNAYNFSDGNSTFDFFDDFTGTVSDKWNVCSGSNVTFSNGLATFATATAGDKALITTRNGFSEPVVAGLKITGISGGAAKTVFLSLHDGTLNGYALCYTPTTNQLDIRSLNAGPVCFSDEAPSGSANYFPGNNFWQLRWISSSSQRATAEGSTPSNDLNYTYNEHGFPGTMYASVGLYNDAATFTADWFFIRKFAVNDNISSTLDAEVMLPVLESVVVMNNSPLCEGSSLQLSANDIPNATLSWSKDGNPLPGGRTYTKNNIDISDAGDYTLTIVPGLGGACPSYTVFEKVTVYPSTKAGVIQNGGTHVCEESNSGSLILSGQTGSVKRWEYSLTGSDPWYTASNTTATQNYSNLSASTSYRVVVQSGTCPEQITSPATVIVDQKPLAGHIAGAGNICQGQNISLKAEDYRGSIVKWLFSTDSVNWNVYTSLQATVTFSSLSATTWYKIIAGNGMCSNDTSAPVKVQVNVPSQGGIVHGLTVCKGSSGIVSLNGNKGDVLRWEISTSGGDPWVTIASSGQSIPFVNLNQTSWFRAVVQNGACSTALSQTDTVIVDQPVAKGTMYGKDSVCTGLNNGQAILSQYTGKIGKWQYSNDGISWVDLSCNRDTLTFSNLTSTHYYRAFLRSDLRFCPDKTSDSARIVVNATTVGGTIDGAASVCATSNKGNLKLSGQTGKILRWERSPSGNDPWYIIANTTDTLTWLNLPETTWYRAVVKNGNCPEMASEKAGISVTPSSVAGSVTGAAGVCAKNNDGVLLLAGYRGDVKKWQQSVDRVKWNLASYTRTC